MEESGKRQKCKSFNMKWSWMFIEFLSHCFVGSIILLDSFHALCMCSLSSENIWSTSAPPPSRLNCWFCIMGWIRNGNSSHSTLTAFDARKVNGEREMKQSLQKQSLTFPLLFSRDHRSKRSHSNSQLPRTVKGSKKNSISFKHNITSKLYDFDTLSLLRIEF